MCFSSNVEVKTSFASKMGITLVRNTKGFLLGGARAIEQIENARFASAGKIMH